MNINELSELYFSTYADSVIKNRAISRAEDNLKPIHRRILYTLWLTKLTSDKEAKKSMATVGEVLKLSPHGDASVYGALVRLAQWWKVRYPLVEMQGNCGNIMGDSAAAARYTNAKLSPIGDMLLDGINDGSVDFCSNYDESMREPLTLPSKFPYILCGNNSGIAVGISCDIVSHNFTEVKDAINYFMANKNCNTQDLLKFIKGPDFPTGGRILNGEDLLEIYNTGKGALRVQSHYEVVNRGSKTVLIFHDIPYGVEIEDGIKKPLKKLVIEEGYDEFESIDVKKVGPKNFDIEISLSKGANVEKCLDILFKKTRLENTVKINNTFIVDGEPKILNLKQMIEYWVNYRSGIILKIAKQNEIQLNNKLEVVNGIITCIQDENRDKLISIITSAENEADAKEKIKSAFGVNDNQVSAVMDIKLSRLTKLNIADLKSKRDSLIKSIDDCKTLENDETKRYAMISKDLDEIKKVIGEDKRLTEICGNYNVPSDSAKAVELPKKIFYIYNNKVLDKLEEYDNNLISVSYARTNKEIITYTKKGELNSNLSDGLVAGAFVVNNGVDDRIVCITKNGNIKVSSIGSYNLSKREKALKLKDDDELVFVGSCGQNEYVVIYGDGNRLLKLSIKDLNIAGKLTLGVKSGISSVSSAAVVNDNDLLFLMNKDGKARFTSVKDLDLDNRGNKGQQLPEDTIEVRKFEPYREELYVIPTRGKIFAVPKDKLSIKGKNAVGATITSRSLINVI
jgi:DNA gyrase subunit A